MKKITGILALMLAVIAPAAAQGRYGKALEGAVVGISAKTMDGKVLMEENANIRMVPASNLKLITTGTALLELGPGFRFETALGYTGKIENGTLKGDLYIIGGGDPTIGARDSIAISTDALFNRWRYLLRWKGVERIEGRIIGDGRAWEGYLEHPSWSYDDLGTYYGPGADALSFYKNAIDYDVSAGAKVSEPVNVKQTYPETPWMHFENRSVTGPANTGNSLYLYTTDLAPYSELRGTYSMERKPKTEHFANKYGALTCAYYFKKYLEHNGVYSAGAAFTDRSGNIIGEDFAVAGNAGKTRMMGSTESAELVKIARETNLISDNFYAEALLREMGEKYCGNAAYDSCRVARSKALEKLGLNPEDAVMVDGSGLSRMNALSPAFMTEFLTAMASSRVSKEFIGTIPKPGEGSVKVLLEGKPFRERFRLKSGSMEGVLCYSGYLLDEGGTPIASVSILVNGATAKPQQTRRALERILEEIFLLSL